MAQLLLIDDDSVTLGELALILKNAGHHVAASADSRGLDYSEQSTFDVAVTHLRLSDLSKLEFLQILRERPRSVACMLITASADTEETTAAMCLGVVDVREKPIGEDILLQVVATVLSPTDNRRPVVDAHSDIAALEEAHAAARWARVIAPIVDSPADPRTLNGWSRIVSVSPGALRNWCRTARVLPRRSLVFARLLRAVFLGRGGLRKPEDLLNVVDRRTLCGLLDFAGLNPKADLPEDIDTFLQRQVLVRDPAQLVEIRRALDVHLARRDAAIALNAVTETEQLPAHPTITVREVSACLR